MPATVSLIAMLRNQLDDECNAMMELCKSDVESGPNQLALTTVIDNKEQVKIYLAEMQARLKAIVGPSLVVMEHDPIFDTIHCGTINNDVQLNCVTGGVLAVVTLLSEAESLVVAVTDETATLRVKHLYTDEMFDAEFEVTPNMHHPDMIAIRYVTGMLNLTGDPSGMKEIRKHMDICISLAAALLTTPVIEYHPAAATTAGRRSD